MKIRIAFHSDIPKIIAVAEKVFKQHYASILSQEQIDYMYDKMYSHDSLLQQMKDGVTYFICEIDEIPVAYMAYFLKEDNNIYLSKLYVDMSMHKSGVGKQLYQTLENIAIKNKCDYIELNVHRKNTAMYFYKKMGFELHENADLACGKYSLCDYVLRKYLKPK